MTQPTLFEVDTTPAPVTRKPAKENRESVEALRSIDSRKIDSSIIAYMRENFNVGFTCDELEVALGMRHQTASSAVWRLKNAHLPVETERRKATRSGRMARVLVLVD